MNATLSLLAACLVAAAPPTFEVRTIDGQRQRGLPIQWTAETLVLETEDGDTSLPIEQLQSVEAIQPSNEPAADGAWVALSDGSIVAAGSFTTSGDTAALATTAAGEIRITQGDIDYVRFQAVLPAVKDEWERIREMPIDEDLVVIGKGDSLDYLGGVVRGVDDANVQFELDGDILPVKRSKVFAVRYYRSETEPQLATARISDTDGSRWAVESATLDKDRLLCRSPLGYEVNLPLASVVRVDFAAPGLVYLTDLKPHSLQWSPYFGSGDELPALSRFYRPRVNTTFQTTPIMLDGTPYEHGLVLHSRSEVVYRLAEPFARFQTLAGVDDQLRPRGHVELRIFGDDRLLYQGEVAGTESARAIDLDLNGVSALRMVVDFGADLDVGDHLILAEPKLLK